MKYYAEALSNRQMIKYIDQVFSNELKHYQLYYRITIS